MNNECSCEICKSYCEKRPGWPTPEEARLAIEAGYTDQYMLDWWQGENDNILLIAPAIEGHGGTNAPFWPIGRCVLLDDNGLCTIHFSGFKPLECRTAHHAIPADPDLHLKVAEMWDTEEGRAVVELWRQQK